MTAFVDDHLVEPFTQEIRPTLGSLLIDTEQDIPISSLPPEMLSEIFVLCCQPKYNAIRGVDIQGICPLHLSAVCKAWRDLAWTTSRNLRARITPSCPTFLVENRISLLVWETRKLEMTRVLKMLEFYFLQRCSLVDGRTRTEVGYV